MGSSRPTLLVVDDLQWSDRESLQYVHYLLRTVAGARLMVLATARPEDIGVDTAAGAVLTALRQAGLLTEVQLERLPPADIAALAERLTGRVLESAAAERLWRDTEGIPLFAVESVRSGWPARGSDSPRVQAVLATRLGQLSPAARDVAGVAAAIGRDFPVELLAAAGGLDDDAVADALDELWRRRIIRERGSFAYDFSHDKLRAAAYAALGPAVRRHVHERIAVALDAVVDRDLHSARIAAHFEQAGRPAIAADRYTRAAAAAAQQLHANHDAVRLLERARRVLADAPPSDERNQLELAILTALPASLASVEGYASPRLSRVHQRALELVASSGAELAAPMLWSMAFTSLVREEFEQAETFADALRTRGTETADDVLTVQGACLLGLAAFWRNDLPRATASLQEVVERYHPEQRPTHLQRFGQDPLVMALGRLGNIRYLRGDPAGAVAARDAALATAGEVGQPLTVGAALVFAGLLALDLGDSELVRRYSVELDDHRQSGTPGGGVRARARRVRRRPRRSPQCWSRGHPERCRRDSRSAAGARHAGHSGADKAGRRGTGRRRQGDPPSGGRAARSGWTRPRLGRRRTASSRYFTALIAAGSDGNAAGTLPERPAGHSRACLPPETPAAPDGASERSADRAALRRVKGLQ